MDGSTLASSALLPVGALASLLALPILGLENMRASSPEPAPVVAARVESRAKSKGPRIEDPRFVVRFAARDIDRDVDVASQRADESGEVSASRDLVVALTALMVLKPEHRFRTTYSARGRVTENTLWGDLVVDGRGDPTVDDIRLRDVANRLYQGGIARITGAIVLDDSFFRSGITDEIEGVDEEGEPRPLTDEGADAGVASEAVAEAPVVDTPSVPSAIRAFPFAHNTLTVVVRPGAKRGAPAIVDVVPRTSFLTVRALVRTEPHARRLKSIAFVDGERGYVVVTGAVALGDAPRSLTVSLPDGAFAYGHTLNDELRRRGVKTTGRVTAVDAGGRRRWLMSDFSSPLPDVLATMLRGSGRAPQGFVRDRLLRVLGATWLSQHGVAATGVVVVKKHLEDDLAIDGARFDLATNRLPPSVVVDALAFGGKTFELKSELEVAIGAASLHPLLSRRLDGHLTARTRAVAFVDDRRADVAGFLGREDGTVLAFSLQASANGETSVDDMWAIVNRALLAVVDADKGAESARGLTTRGAPKKARARAR